jgi:hypothetical protein
LPIGNRCIDMIVVWSKKKRRTKMIKQEGPVCAYCDVWCRATYAQYDDEGRPFLTWTACAYCGRTELRLRKLGHQTPIPKCEPAPDDRCPF